MNNTERVKEIAGLFGPYISAKFGENAECEIKKIEATKS